MTGDQAQHPSTSDAVRPTGEGSQTGRLDEYAQALATSHVVTQQPSQIPELLERIDAQALFIRKAYHSFSGAAEKELAASYAAEWLLDNFYVVQQALRQVQEDMPQGYYRQLPKLANTTLEGYPRVYAIARELVRSSNAQIDPERLQQFVRAYQEVQPLTMGEIWALPTMLRLVIFDVLALGLARVLDEPAPDGETPEEPVSADLAADTLVANSIIALRSLVVQDWKAFFESVNQVEQILNDDPANVYARMDFDTRDQYRKVVEELALSGGLSEVAVARQSIDLATRAQADDASPQRQRHVGYYLIDRGRKELENRLGYRAGRYARFGRWLLDHATMTYLGSITLTTLAIWLTLLAYARASGAGPGQFIVAGLLGLVPSVTVAISLVNWLVTQRLPPTVLPKMDFSDGIPTEYPTMVIVPALLSNSDDVTSLLQQLELHYLRNTDTQLHFALLTDYGDAPAQVTPEDEALLQQTLSGIRLLNERYRREPHTPFYLFHRERRWNPSEAAWMGWERKRGKLEEFNRLVLGDANTSFIVRAGDLEILPKIRYVITLDADTVLPRGSARRLVGTLTHPLNRAEFAPDSDRVVSGYTVLQPRTEIEPTVGNASFFTQIFAGDTGLDLYTHAVSDVHQDLFGEGIYVGKGIYDLAAFHRALAGQVPENTLLSHDLLEGLLGRAGLVTDISVYEDYPTGYLENTTRLYRWIRGDWQLLPWLIPHFPQFGPKKRGLRLRIIDRWKILDNLRRSLVAPMLLALLVLSWLWLPGSPLIWTLAGVLTTAVPLFTSVATELARSERGELAALRNSIWRQVQRWLFSLVFLPYEAWIAADAIGITLGRLFVTRRHLLQWRTAANTARLFGDIRQKHAEMWSRMLVAVLTTGAMTILIILFMPTSLPVAVPLLLAWMVSPRLAFLISQPIQREEETITDAQRQQLRNLARRTWWYFEQFVGPEDHWLPPDHFQEHPRGVVAHRTSPTNMGLSLLSTLGAYDLGYISLLDLVLRLRDTFRSMDQLERHRGHILNWYDTRTLAPLPPRYVSTVDSGNLAACLLALRQACFDLEHAPILRWQRWQAFLDVAAILGTVVDDLEHVAGAERDALESKIDQMRQEVLQVRSTKGKWAPLLAQLIELELPEMEQRLVTLIESSGSALDADELRRLHVWMAQVRNHLESMQQELDMLVPWLLPFMEPPTLLSEADPKSNLGQAWRDVIAALPPDPQLDRMGEIWRKAEAQLSQLVRELRTIDDGYSREQIEAAREWCRRLIGGLSSAPAAAAGILISTDDLSKRAEEYVRAMDFRFLYDGQRRVFRIGYNVDAETPDSNYYDLLASEARIASLVAIAKGDVPQQHWLHLGRPLTRINNKRTLLSWNGSMFEYLMPIMLLRQYRNTLLYQSVASAVAGQMAYGLQRNLPWGISESSYYRFDNQLNYQYRGFGVPGLGFKRGLGEDLVISPYASLLALPVRPQAVIDNVDRLTELGMIGQYGFYEAADFTPTRLGLGQEFAVVRSFMVHHQSMILLSLVNYLYDNVMVERFHSDPRIQSVDLLLQEQIPSFAPVEEATDADTTAVRPDQPQAVATPWHLPVETPFPEVHFLSNGRFGTLVTNGGGGYIRWGDFDLTRWRADPTLDNWGTWIYIQDLASGDLWSAGQQPIPGAIRREVVFYPHQALLQCTMREVATHVEITVPPDDDVEIRRLTFTNQSDEFRRLRVVSYSELVLGSQETDRRHPAFNKLFIESEYVASHNCLVFRRRPRSGEESPVHMGHALVVKEGWEVQPLYETDRVRFIGRGGMLQAPAALHPEGELTGTTGAVLDPIMSLAGVIELEPHATAQITYITTAAKSRDEVLALVQRYQDWSQIAHAFGQARTQSEIELRELELDIEQLQRIQQLLSVLLYPTGALRAEPENLEANRLGQAGLWPFSISGDYPILLVQVSEEEDTALVHEMLRAHIYWRRRGLKIDLVILNEKETGYAQELQGQLNRLLRRLESEDWLNQRGGIFMVRSDSLAPEERWLLFSAARAVLDGNKGTLVDQLAGIRRLPARLPALEATREPDRERDLGPSRPRPRDLRFDNGLGGFTPDGQEYVVYLEPGHWTPAPWINVIANPHFGFLISEAGGGYTWSVNSGENRLTPWHNDPVRDPPGEALYLRDEETAEVWSPTPLPAGAPMPYLIRHGAGYTIFEHTSHHLKQRMRVFGAQNDPVKIVQLRVENTEDRVRRVTATYYAEWVLGVNRDGMQQYVVPEFVEHSHALLARNAYNSEFGARVAFVAASKELHSLTADRTEFLGRLGGLYQPAALRRVGLSGTVRAGLDPCAALQLHMDLQPGASEEVFFLIGQGSNREEALDCIKRYSDTGQLEAAWQQSAQFWKDLLGAVTVDTPDPAMNLMLNQWLLYQDLSCRLWGRSALYQSSGAFGFRDQLQDVMALLHAAPEIARQHILRAAGHQFEAGDVLHWWHPPSGRGVRTRISDDLLWLPFVTAQYVATTGDAPILKEKVPFLTGAPLASEEEERYGHHEKTATAYTLYEHCRRAIKHGSTSGSHGLPLIGTGDWNDGMNRVGIEGRGQSVWLGWFLYATLTAFIPVCELVGDSRQARAYQQQADALQAALEESAWDGAWYRRAYYDDGTPLGSAQNRECKIDSIAQSWAVLSEAGAPERASIAMDSVKEWLLRPQDRLLLLFTPPLDGTARDPGYIKGYPPGIRENGGQYTHAAIWAAWAWARLGDGDQAEALFRLLNPIYHAATAEHAARYKVEPYVVAADVYSVPPHTGRGGWTWYTGSGGWLYRLGTEAILGLQRSGDVLRIEPCIPRDWPGYRLTYRYGRAHYEIDVENPDGVSWGIREVTLDGEVVPDGGIPLTDDGRRHRVGVRLGEATRERQTVNTAQLLPRAGGGHHAGK